MSSDQTHTDPHQRWDSPTPTFTNPTTSKSRLAPYLTLPHHLSLTWLATPILSLIFVAFRLFISSADAQQSADEAKRTLLSSCQAAQRSAVVAMNIPMFMAEGTNRLIEKSINESIEVAKDTMIFSLTALQGIIEFVIDIYRSTFLCFLELIVRGSLAAVIGAANTISAFVTDSLNTVRTSIQSDVQKANDFISSAVDGINRLIPSVLNIRLSVPTFDVPSLSGLQNVQLPTTVQDALTNLNSTVPTVDDIRDKLDAIIAIPFTNLKNDINQSFAGIRFTAPAIRVPEQQTLSFCDSLNVSVVDQLAQDIVKIAKVGSLILLGCAVLLILGNCAIQWYKWRVLQNRLNDVRDGWGGNPDLVYQGSIAPGAAPTMELSDRNLLTLFTAMQHPFSTSVAQWISDFLRLSPQKHINLRFFFAYIFSPPALACLLIGAFGVLSVQVQLAALGPIQEHYSVVVRDSINDFSQTIADQVNGTMLSQSAAYANSVNTQVDTLQTSVNTGVFGWVNGTVVPLNNTIAAFYADIQDAVEKVFGGTVLDTATQEFLRCLIGTKVQALENALTFVQENFQVKVPKVEANVLMLSDSNVKQATEPIAQAAVGGDGENDGVVAQLVNRYVASLEKERTMFLIFLILWGVVVLMAFFIIWWSSYGSDLLFMWRKRKFDQAVRERTAGGVVTPWLSSGPRMIPVGPDFPTSSADLDKKSQSYFFDSEKTFAKPFVQPQPPKLQISYPIRQPDPTPALTTYANIGKESSQSEQESKRASRKLRASGRRAMGRETLITEGDEISGSPEGSSALNRANTDGFFGRLGNMFVQKGSQDDEGYAISQSASPDDKAGHLQVAMGESRSIRTPSGQVQLPPPPPLHNSNIPPTQSIVRARKDVPQSLSGMSIFGTSPPQAAGPFSSANTVPIHHAFVSDSQQPQSQGPPRIPTPPSIRTRLSAFPPRMSTTSRVPPPEMIRNSQVPQGPRLLTPGQARKSSLVDPSLVTTMNANIAGLGSGMQMQQPQPRTPGPAARNPFSTPFDDENGVAADSSPFDDIYRAMLHNDQQPSRQSDVRSPTLNGYVTAL